MASRNESDSQLSRIGPSIARRASNLDFETLGLDPLAYARSNIWDFSQWDVWVLYRELLLRLSFMIGKTDEGMRRRLCSRGCKRYFLSFYSFMRCEFAWTRSLLSRILSNQRRHQQRSPMTPQLTNTPATRRIWLRQPTSPKRKKITLGRSIICCPVIWSGSFRSRNGWDLVRVSLLRLTHDINWSHSDIGNPCYDVHVITIFHPWVEVRRPYSEVVYFAVCLLCGPLAPWLGWRLCSAGCRSRTT